MTLTNHFNSEEQQKFKVLETEKCSKCGKRPQITFPNNRFRIKTCCDTFEIELQPKINAIRNEIIKSRT